MSRKTNPLLQIAFFTEELAAVASPLLSSVSHTAYALDRAGQRTGQGRQAVPIAQRVVPTVPSFYLDPAEEAPSEDL